MIQKGVVMAITLQITNIENVLAMICQCSEPVKLVHSADDCCDLRTNMLVQDELRALFATNGKVLSLTLQVCSEQDYFRLTANKS